MIIIKERVDPSNFYAEASYRNNFINNFSISEEYYPIGLINNYKDMFLNKLYEKITYDEIERFKTEAVGKFKNFTLDSYINIYLSSIDINRNILNSIYSNFFIIDSKYKLDKIKEVIVSLANSPLKNNLFKKKLMFPIYKNINFDWRSIDLGFVRTSSYFTVIKGFVFYYNVLIGYFGIKTDHITTYINQFNTKVYNSSVLKVDVPIDKLAFIYNSYYLKPNKRKSSGLSFHKENFGLKKDNIHPIRNLSYFLENYNHIFLEGLVRIPASPDFFLNSLPVEPEIII